MRSADSHDPRIRKSLDHAVRDGVAVSVMTGAGDAYFSAYALLLKAGTAQISLLTALPALLGSAAQLLSAWLAGRVPRRKPVILLGIALQLLSWPAIIWLPYFFPAQAVEALIAAVALHVAAVNLSAPLWSSVMGDLVPERRRGRYFGRRNRYISITNFLALICAGTVLHFAEANAATRLGFTLIFCVAWMARAVSFYHVNAMHEPARTPQALRLPPMAEWKRLLAHSPFLRFLAFGALFNGAVGIAAPFFVVYMLRDLGFSYLEYTASTGISILASFLSFRLWGRLADVFGNRMVMLVCGALIPVFPLLWLLMPNFWYVAVLQLLGGFFWAGFGLASGNYVYDSSPPALRSAYAASYSVLCNLGVFGGALLGGLLSAIAPTTVMVGLWTFTATSGLWLVLVASSAARGVVALLFLARLKEVRAVRKTTPVSLFVRAVGLRAWWQRLRAATVRAPTTPPAAPGGGDRA